MSHSNLINHTVDAFNISASSENKIHDDNIAKRFGFQGGLVPGVEVYAYMTNPIIQFFGYQWLEIGSMECKFCLLYTSPSPRDVEESRMPSSA